MFMDEETEAQRCLSDFPEITVWRERPELDLRLVWLTQPPASISHFTNLYFAKLVASIKNITSKPNALFSLSQIHPKKFLHHKNLELFSSNYILA